LNIEKLQNQLRKAMISKEQTEMELQSAEDTIKEMKHQSNAAQIKF
jgi:hypothetical protein